MKHMKILAIFAVMTFLSACSSLGPSRTAPIVVLAKDYFNDQMPSTDRVFVYTAQTPPSVKPKFIYLISETPSYLWETKRKSYDDAVESAIKQLGFEDIRNKDQVNDLLRKNNIDVFPMNTPSEAQLKLLHAKEGPFLIISAQYNSIISSRIAYIVNVIDPATSSVLLNASYDTIVWNDVPKELIYPIFNVFANWYHNQISYKPAN